MEKDDASGGGRERSPDKSVARVESPSLMTARARSTTSRSVKQPAWTASEHGLPDSLGI